MARSSRRTADGVEAFVDHGFASGETFTRRYLGSSDFTREALSGLSSLSERASKDEHAQAVAEAYRDGRVQAREILDAFVWQPRTWLSFKTGSHAKQPAFEDPGQLLTETGEAQWYGPVSQHDGATRYIRTAVLEHRTAAEGDDRHAQIRWPVVAEITRSYAALSWNGFSYSRKAPSGYVTSQYRFWDEVLEAWDELAKAARASWQHPPLHTLVLEDLWDRYRDTNPFDWRDLRIRAANNSSD